MHNKFETGWLNVGAAMPSTFGVLTYLVWLISYGTDRLSTLRAITNAFLCLQIHIKRQSYIQCVHLRKTKRKIVRMLVDAVRGGPRRSEEKLSQCADVGA